MKIALFRKPVVEDYGNGERLERRMARILIYCGYDAEFDDYSLRVHWGLQSQRTEGGLFHKHQIRIGFYRRRASFSLPFKCHARWS